MITKNESPVTLAMQQASEEIFSISELMQEIEITACDFFSDTEELLTRLKK